MFVCYHSLYHALRVLPALGFHLCMHVSSLGPVLGPQRVMLPPDQEILPGQLWVFEHPSITGHVAFWIPGHKMEC